MGGFLDKTGLTTPQVTTNKILLEGDNLKDLLANAGSDNLPLLSSRYDNAGLETYAWKLADGTWLDGRIYTEAFNKIREMYQNGDTNVIMMEPPPKLPTTLTDNPDKFIFSNLEWCFRLPLYVAGDRILIKEEIVNDYNCYKIYSGGWCEMCGRYDKGSVSNAFSSTITLPYEMKNANYLVTLTASGMASDKFGLFGLNAENLTTTSFAFYFYTSGTGSGFDNDRIQYVYWKVEGYVSDTQLATALTDAINSKALAPLYFKVANGLQGDLEKFNPHEKLLQFESDARQLLTDTIEEVAKDYVVYTDKQVGELYFSFNNYYPDGVIPLDGRLVSRATYADLWQWVQEKGLVKDDSLITTNDENTVSIFNEDGTVKYCSWYGNGDGSLTFRVPKINGYIKASGDNSSVGQYTAEGLPNIEGKTTIPVAYFSTNGASGGLGAIKQTYNSSYSWAGGNRFDGTEISLNASRSNTIYGNSEHVTPETNTLFVGVWAITASKAAVFDMRDIEEALKSSESYLMNNVPLMSSRWDRDGLGNLGWVKADGSWVDGKTYTGAYNYCVEKLVNGHEDFIDGQVATITTDNCSKFIVDRINKRFRLPISNGQRQLVAAYKEGTQWYNIYSDGWIEQGGEVYNNADANITVDLLVPFRDTSYTVDRVMGVDGAYNGGFDASHHSTWNYTTSSFTTSTYESAGLNRFRWFAAGYGEILSVSSPLRTSHLYFKLAHEFYSPAQAEIQEKLDLIDNLVAKTDINLPTLSSRWDSDFAENVGWVKSEGQWLNGNTYRDAYDLMVSRIGINDKFVAATVGTELTDENADKFLIDTTAVKFRLPLINGERVLVSTYKEDKNWYNLYSDGWLEQGGFLSCPSEPTTLTLFKPYKAVDYTVTTTGSKTSYNAGNIVITSRTVTSISFFMGDDSSFNVGDLHWRSIGFSEIPALEEYNRGNYLFFKLADEVPSTIVNTQQIIDDLKTECNQFRQTLETLMNQGHFVIETYTNGTNWYRKYSDGWIEQGGRITSFVGGNAVTLHTAFSNTNYTVIGICNNSRHKVSVQSRTNTAVTINVGINGVSYNNETTELEWYACGY